LKFNRDATKFLMRFSTAPVERIKHLLVANTDGTGLTRLDTLGHKWHHHSWLNDGHSILFGHINRDGTPNLYRIDCDNTNLRLLSKHPLAGHPIISPDGTRIVTDDYDETKTRGSILLLNLETDTVETIASFTANLKRANAHPVWNHDGTQILYHSDHTGYSRLYLIEV
jgi:Tol biopolymer transport system component